MVATAAVADRLDGGISALRDQLYGAIRSRLAERPDGTLSRHWGAVLHIARRRDGAAGPS